eukprot:CAMPEP_0114142462 /NCGR_PEP_ID=MMETSP0043_2-20121206/18459_1 /TAXON_ID=464988 /ORGANISM="Hemiselmis andersenii, Strain CCMP644" /LENGTH=383 /DNA_ID=CAMNT_0001236681 /DNA_START=180 /DNA_END=1327 /DNA_ORIENTATION=+
MAALNMLLELDGDTEVKNKKGDTPLHTSAREKHIETMRVLLRSGADHDAVNIEGKTPLELFAGSEVQLRLDIMEGVAAREERARKKKEAAEKLAMERKLAEASKAVRVQKTVVDAESKRRRYLELRDKLTTKMKVSKASHERGMGHMASVLDSLREAERRRQALARQREEGWRGLEKAEEALASEEAKRELQSAEERGLEEEEIDAKKELISLEVEAMALSDNHATTDVSLMELRGEVGGLEERCAGLERLLPVAALLRTALRVKEDRERTGWVPPPDPSTSLHSLGTPTPAATPAPEIVVGPLEKCARCGTQYHDDPVNNRPTACRFHPGERVVTSSWAVGWSCCNRRTQGCRTSTHTTVEQIRAAEMARKRLPPAPPPHAP